MRRLYLNTLISLGTAVIDPLYAQISLDFEPLLTLTLPTSPPDTSTAGFNTGLTSSRQCASTSSRCLTHRPAFNKGLERWPWLGPAVLPAPLPCTKNSPDGRQPSSRCDFSLSGCVHKGDREEQVATGSSDPLSHRDLAPGKFASDGILGSAEPSTPKWVI